MPRRKRVPKYSLHKASGQARAVIDGKHVYLGRYGSPESREAYARLIAERFYPANEEPFSPPNGQLPEISIDELLLRYLQYAKTYYVKDGRPTKELTCMEEAMGHVRALYGSNSAHDFGPKKLKAIRRHMIDLDLARGVINNRVNRIKRIFKWAVSEELVPPTIYEGLRAVAGLRYGRSDARETEPVRPVPDAWVDAVVPHVSPQVAAMINLQRLTGMRPCEVVLIRPCDIDMSGDVWVYEPPDHKNRWRGHRRLIPLGPQAQAIVRPFLHRRLDAFLFSPREAEEWRNSMRRLRRQSPMTPSQARRKPKKNPKRLKRERYDTDSYRRAVTYGIRKANRSREDRSGNTQKIPHWCPLQLRHSFATNVRKKFGVEAAQVGLGHARTNIVDIYAEKNLSLAVEIARKTG
jgi:integrase